MSPVADRNLLFGLLALQMDLLSREQLIDGFHDWMLRKDTPVADVLRQRGALAAEDLDAVEALVRRRLARHGGDVQHSLAGLRVETPVEEALRSLGDAEVAHSIGHCGRSMAARQKGAEAAPTNGAAPMLRYRRLHPHARGGLGEVSVALDVELNREVALKEIQERFADDSNSRFRFVREAEITGNLEHPGIVPVYGLGTYADGRPYYAMRFIKGESLHQAIKRFHQGPPEPMTLRSLLNRFVAVCNAVAYAHARGVIHRDVKPDNVMLGEFGETLVVDWGLARLLEVEDETATRAETPVKVSSGDSTPTEMGRALGTPGYMSPEQAAGRLNEVREASDIFALGATLYHLLTGRAPYAGSDALAQAERGGVTPARQVKRAVPSALEAVCARALAARPAQRYRSARELGAEVERWLADEPVAAHREPWLDRARRWGRKHRTLVTGCLVFLLVGVIGLGGGLAAVSAEQRRTADQRDRAIDNEERAVAAEHKATDNLAIAEANLKLAKKAVNDTFDLAKSHPLLQQKGKHEVRKLLLEKALPFYKKFRVLRGDDPRSRAALAEQYFRVGYITNEIGNKTEARRSFAQAEKLLRSLVKSNPAVTLYQDNLASTFLNMGVLLQAEGKRQEALAAYKQARNIQQKLVKANPAVTKYQNDLAGTLNNMGNVLKDEGKRQEALAAYTQARAILEKQVEANPGDAKYLTDLAGTLINMGNLRGDMKQPKEALAHLDESLKHLHAALKSDPRHALATEFLWRTYSSRALTLTDLKRHADAAADWGKFVLVAPPSYRLLGRVRRAHSLALAGQFAQVMKEAEEIARVPQLPGDFLYDLACVAALCSPGVARDATQPLARREQQAESRARQAVAWLKEAHKAGYFKTEANRTHMAKDADLDSLRGRADFKTFVASLTPKQDE